MNVTHSSLCEVLLLLFLAWVGCCARIVICDGGMGCGRAVANRCCCSADAVEMLGGRILACCGRDANEVGCWP